jgi:acid phosphatase type 7
MKTINGKLRAALLMGAAASMLVFAAGAQAQIGRSPVLAVVGDIACQPSTEANGEASKETCTDPKSPYNGTNNPTVPPSYSLWESQEYTANQIETMKPDAVALLGDLQYQVGRYSDFEQSFDLTYGAFKFLHRPAPGNHEFYDEHGETGVAGYGYFSYYNGFLINTGGAGVTPGTPVMATISDPCPSNPACGPGSTLPVDLSAQPIPRADGQAGHFEESGGLGTAVYYNGPSAGTAAPVGVGDGWYSYNLGGWHLISLNIECSTQPGGCSTTSSAPDNWFDHELAWLKQDLEKNHSACTAAYWHQPTFSATNGITPEGIAAQAFWQLLYEHHADLVLNGHDHLYAHYRPLDPFGNYDPRRGIREFIVGTGGETLDPVTATTVTSGTGETNMEDPSGNVNFNAENLEAGTGDYWGVMALTLDPNGYRWNFQSKMEGPVNNGQWPAVAPTGFYSDAGSGGCHNGGDHDHDQH